MRRLALIAVVAALALAPAAALADATTGALRLLGVDTSEHPTVSLRVSAPRELVGSSPPAEAFSLTEDGEARTGTVEKVRGDDLEVVLAIDTSGSMDGRPMEAAKTAAVGFLDQLPEDAHVAVVEFNSAAQVISPLSKDMDTHRAAIGQVYARQSTVLYDAVSLSLQQLSDGDARSRAVVLLSDGGDNGSAADLDTITRQVAASDATLYAIELETETTEPAILERLAAAGNGPVVSAADPDKLAGLYATIAAELRDSYILTYRSEAQGRVGIRVTVEHPGGQAELSHRVSMPSPPVVPFAPGILASPWTLVLGAALMFAALALLLATVLWPGEMRSLLSRGRSGGAGGGRSLPGMATVANRATLVVERNLTKHGWTPSLNASLERAGISLRPGEFVVLSICAAVAAFTIGFVLNGMLLGLLLIGVVAILSVFGLKVLGGRRRAKFADQLGETLQLMSGSLRAGYSLLQAVDAVAREADSPTAEEYRRIVVETRLGRELEDALHAMDDRIGSEDFQWVVQAIAIHREVGGDLAEVLDTVAKTIRERNQIRRQVQALSAEGKLSAIVLYVLPFAVAGFVSLTNPSYLSVLIDEPIGWAMLAVGAVLMAVGGLWLRKVVRIVF